MLDDFKNNTNSGYLDNSGSRYFLTEGVECVAVEFIWALLICISSTTLFFSIVTVRIMRTVSIAYVANLAIAGFLVGLHVIIKILRYFVGNGVKSKHIFCLLKTFFQLVSVEASLFTLVMVGTERYMFCFHPHMNSKVFRRWVNVTIMICIWIFATGVTIFAMCGHRSYNESAQCHVGSVLSRNGLVIVSVIFILAVILVSTIYPAIAFQLWWVRRRVNPCTDISTGSTQMQTETRTDLRVNRGLKAKGGAQRTILKPSAHSSSESPSLRCDYVLSYVRSDVAAITGHHSTAAENIPSSFTSRGSLGLKTFQPIPMNILPNSSLNQQNLSTVESQTTSDNNLRRKKVTFIIEQRTELTLASCLNRKEIRLVKTLFLVVVYMFIAWIPIIYVANVKPPDDMAKWVFCVMHILLYSSSFLNTVFFFCLCRNFRLAGFLLVTLITQSLITSVAKKVHQESLSK